MSNELVYTFVLGIVQGVTEWLPISSEGINSLILVNLFEVHIAEAIYLSLWLHLGTLTASIFYFRKELLTLLTYLPTYFGNIHESQKLIQGKTLSFIIVATIISLAIAAPIFFFSLDTIQFNGHLATVIIGILLIVTGLVQKFAIHSGSLQEKQPGLLDSILVGIAQGISVLPGLSRSGLTISVLLFRRHHAEQAGLFQ